MYEDCLFLFFLRTLFSFLCLLVTCRLIPTPSRDLTDLAAMSAKHMIGIDPTNIIDGSRNKRRRGAQEDEALSPSNPDVEMEDPDQESLDARANGLHILAVLKSARSKE
jgi:hypothetical protein